jgi:hypothetical protein
MTETIASVQADTDHTARTYAAILALASVPASDLAAWIAYSETGLLTVTPVGDGFVVTFADDLDGHPVASTVAVPAGTSPADLGLNADLIEHATAVARELDERWTQAQQADTLKRLDDEWAASLGEEAS